MKMLEDEPASAFMASLKVILTVSLGLLGTVLPYLYNALIRKPRRLRRRLESQGIRGPPPHLLLGNIPDVKAIQAQAAEAHKSSRDDDDGHRGISHAWPSRVYPHLYQWQAEYGPMFMYSTGNILSLHVTDVGFLKELGLFTSLSLGKPSSLAEEMGPLFGEGILSSSGLTWAYHRKVVAPELYLDKVKGMVSLMEDSTRLLLGSWERRIESNGGMAIIKVDDDLRSLSADIISRACFGSSYSEGKDIFLKLRQLEKVLTGSNFGVPGMKYLPTRKNREIWKLDKEIRSMILEVVERRVRASYEKDLLQMILEGANEEDLPSKMSRKQFIVDNCKNIYFAGHETTAVAASWCLMLLAAYPQWQERARAEALEILCSGIFDSDKLRGMKTLTMVIQETLRLYPPAIFTVRLALEDTKIKDLLIPKGSNLRIPIALVQQLPEVWGSDASEFNPERFAHGVSGACKYVQAFAPFGSGPRVCVGQHFAMAELKVVLSLILSKFSFRLSSEYHHSPVARMVIEPKDGIILYMEKV